MVDFPLGALRMPRGSAVAFCGLQGGGCKVHSSLFFLKRYFALWFGMMNEQIGAKFGLIIALYQWKSSVHMRSSLCFRIRVEFVANRFGARCRKSPVVVLSRKDYLPINAKLPMLCDTSVCDPRYLSFGHPTSDQLTGSAFNFQT